MAKKAPQDRKRNILVIGYPKSGNTWATRLLAAAINCPVGGFWGSDHNEIAIEGLERASDFRVFKAHQSYDRLCTIGKFEKFIYMVRDPRDVVCSGAHYWQAKAFNEHYGSNTDKYEAMIQTVLEGSFYPHCRRPWKYHIRDYRYRAGLIVKYEDLLKSTRSELSKIMIFLGLERSQEHLETVVLEQSFESVKSKAKATGDQRNINFLRKGKASSYRNELNAEQCERIVSGCEPEISELGYIK